MPHENVIFKKIDRTVKSDVCNMINTFPLVKRPNYHLEILSKGMLLKKLSSQNDLSSEEWFPSHLKEA